MKHQKTHSKRQFGLSKNIYFLGMAILFVVSVFHVLIPDSIRIFLSMSAGGFYIIGFLADAYATHVTFVQLKHEFDVRGEQFPYYEENGYLPLYPTIKDQIFNVTSLYFLVGLPFAFLIPGFGIGAGYIHLTAVLAHLDVHRRLRAALTLMDRQMI